MEAVARGGRGAALPVVANRYIQSGARIVGTVGVKDLLVIDTLDALLVADRVSVQDVEQSVG